MEKRRKQYFRCNSIKLYSLSYKVTVTNTVTGCSKTTATGTTVSINPLPVALISPSGTISFCAGQRFAHSD
ncbi:MAG: hypothetical protein ABI855_04040 [Bacteroidota bacterium]